MIVQESYNSCQELKLKFSKFQKPQWQLYAQVKLDPPPKRPSGLLLDQENGDIYILNLQVGEHDHGIRDDDAFRYQGDGAVIRYSLQAE